ncbi:MAG: DUF2182 domain-containing protein [Candidatus Rokubacteria bacterium]|nr:DUF2182 domain-containing protein [Candidatus Rokubacteria bacterium]MBI3826688.1 DUF2182 domain-containing protein [Candidatus Rokubacteria bacterium]
MFTAEALARRDRAVTLTALAILAALAWVYLVQAARGMSAMEMHAAMGMVMSPLRPWSLVDAGLLFVMWAVMMVAMMLPSASPMILMFATINRRRLEQGRPAVRIGVFAAGYVLLWTAFAAVAALAQWALHAVAFLSPAMLATSPVLGGSLLVAAGVFQWSRLKAACLANCRSPLAFLMTEWREGARGAFVMGLRHGTYCVGCCWLLMALLFVAGVMNLVWVVALAAFVLAEKAVPGGGRVARAAGILLVIGGAVVLLRPWLG